jgi:beta-glucanase (GH16 family)
VIGLSLTLGAIIVAGLVAVTGQHRGAPRSLRTTVSPTSTASDLGSVTTSSASVSATASTGVAGDASPTPSNLPLAPTHSAARTHAATVVPTHAAIPVPTHAVPALTTPTPTPTPSVTPPSGQTSFSDEFDGSSLDTSKWVALDRSGDSSNQEVGCYAPDHAGVSGGVLTLRTDVAACPDGRPYTSGAIQMRSFFTYGTVEFRSKEAGGAGTWPAEWLLGANCQQTNVASADNTPPCAWPNPGSDEIDIAEIFSYDHTMVNEQIHSGSNQDRCLPHVSDVTQNWHTYQLVWSPGSLVWKIDGVTTCTRTAGIPSTPMFLIVNTAVGGIGGGTVDASTLPQAHQVDYVRIYK